MATRGLEIPYEGDHLSRVAFPLGGMGAGMFCLEGAGAISHVSLRHRPETTNEPCTFAALSVRAGGERIEFARVLEGPVPKRKSFGEPRSALGASRTTFGLPRFAKATFQSRFPFGVVTLSDPKCPLDVTICGWSPFIPGEADLSSLPVAGLEYRFVNRTPHAVDAVFSFNTLNFMAVSPSKGYVARAHGRAGNGFVLGSRGSDERPWDQGEFCAAVIDPDAAVNCAPA